MILDFQRVFSINDGYQEKRVLKKVVHWLNNSSQEKGTTEVSLEIQPINWTLKNGK